MNYALRYAARAGAAAVARHARRRGYAGALTVNCVHVCFRGQAQSRVRDIRAQQALSARVASIATAIGVPQDALLARVAECASSGNSVDAMLESFESAAAAGLSGDQLFG